MTKLKNVRARQWLQWEHQIKRHPSKSLVIVSRSRLMRLRLPTYTIGDRLALGRRMGWWR